MPELPDVEVSRRYLESTSLKRRVERVRTDGGRLFGDSDRKATLEALEGSRLEETARHGKNLFVRLSAGPWLLMHFGMSGFLKAYRRPDSAPDHPRLVMELDDGSSLAYDSQRLLGRLGLAEGPAEYARQKGLGPDLLFEDMTARRFADALDGSRGMIKPALMDQTRMAGLGNVYTDEALFQYGLHPKRKAPSLSGSDLEGLFGTVREVLERAVDFGADVGSAPSDWLLPHRDGDSRCPRCGGELQRIGVSGRTSWVCPERQPAP